MNADKGDGENIKIFDVIGVHLLHRWPNFLGFL